MVKYIEIKTPSNNKCGCLIVEYKKNYSSPHNLDGNRPCMLIGLLVMGSPVFVYDVNCKDPI